MTPLPLQFLVVLLAGCLSRHQQEVIEYLQEENRVLREQLGEKRPRFTDAQRRRLARKAKQLGRRRLREISTFVTPDTLLRWYRELVAAKYDGSSKRSPGRPRIEDEIQRLIVRMALENPRWGYTRIRGSLMNLGHEVGRNTIKRVLAEHGIDPMGRRPMAWKTFLRAHWGAIAATDFFTVEVVTWRDLVRYFVLFVIDLKSRRVEIAGITATPNGEWMQQVARNLVDCEEGFLVNSRHLIHDRDPLFTHAFAGTLERAGVDPVKLPIRSPNLNTYAERFIRSAKSECVGQVIPLGERHLRRVVAEYIEHYHRERNHQGIGNRLIDRDDAGLAGTSSVECHERLGGMLRYYDRAAALPSFQFWHHTGDGVIRRAQILVFSRQPAREFRRLNGRWPVMRGAPRCAGVSRAPRPDGGGIRVGSGSSSAEPQMEPTIRLERTTCPLREGDKDKEKQ